MASVQDSGRMRGQGVFDIIGLARDGIDSTAPFAGRGGRVVTLFLEDVGNGQVQIKVRVQDDEEEVDMCGEDLARDFHSWGGDVGRIGRGSFPKKLFVVQAGLRGLFHAKFGVGEDVEEEQCEVDGGIVYGGKGLLALGWYGETEDGASGVVGVDGGQGGVEGHF